MAYVCVHAPEVEEEVDEGVAVVVVGVAVVVVGVAVVVVGVAVVVVGVAVVVVGVAVVVVGVAVVVVGVDVAELPSAIRRSCGEYVDSRDRTETSSSSGTPASPSFARAEGEKTVSLPGAAVVVLEREQQQHVP